MNPQIPILMLSPSSLSRRRKFPGSYFFIGKADFSMTDSLMQLEVTADTTTPSYWLHWRVLLCAVWVVTPMFIALLMIWKYEYLDRMNSDRGETQQDVNQISCDDKAWRPCLKGIHPIWLLAFRVIAFCLLLGTLVVKVLVNGGHIFYYYTQWTYTLLTIYFGCGSLLSVYGCYQYHLISSRDLDVRHVGRDAEHGSYVPLTYRERTHIHKARSVSGSREENCFFQAAAVCSYVFEVLFQMNAGAVMLTDCVYWFIIFPVLTINDYNLNVMTVNMHTLNAVLLLGDTALNCLRVPFFRISFFILWTGVFIIFQWIIHAFVLIRWPYPFLDLSSPYAPLWYLLMAVMHLPCYGSFALIVKVKLYLLSKWFPLSHQC